MDVFKKFIIETDDELGDCLIIAKCTYHKQIVTDEKKVKGGGWWELVDNKTFLLFGESHEFGRASIEDIKKCIENDLAFSNKYLIKAVTSIYNFSYRDQLGNIIELKKDCLF